ncbi:MAG: Tm-1-like ATP-binding domain-containing protein [Anaerolineae bacterium]|nr:Tm-1-like ATP-binding domain-containing protein [Anaerolineae bacterium]
MNILVIGTLDTKGPEVGYLRDEVARRGGSPLVIDPGILGQPAIAGDVTRQQVARAAGVELADLVATGDRQRCQAAMIEGLVAVVTRLHAEGRVAGVVGVGGAQGTAMATAAMRALPVGLPKVMVSTVACGQTTFGPYVGTKDVTMIHSVADILGLNRVTRRILGQAAAAVVGMAAVEAVAAGDRELIAITQAGITTPGVMAVKEQLEGLGFEVIAFHCNGIGGQAMEELVLDGVVRGVVDYSPHEITDLLFGGQMPAMPGRLEAAGRMGIPHVVTPGATDIRLHGRPEELPAELRARACVQHTPTHTHVRSSAEEMAAVARHIAARLNAGIGPRAVMIPLQGYSMLNRRGQVLYDEAANRAFLEAAREALAPEACLTAGEVELIEVNAHINDRAFADAVVDTFLRLQSEG